MSNSENSVTSADAGSSSSSNAGGELTAIAGSIVLSENPAHQLKYWRKKFGIKQADLAKKMEITPSVLSDYEKGRRPSPGVNFIKRYLLALYELAKGGQGGEPQARGASSDRPRPSRPFEPSAAAAATDNSSSSSNSNSGNTMSAAASSTTAAQPAHQTTTTI